MTAKWWKVKPTTPGSQFSIQHIDSRETTQVLKMKKKTRFEDILHIQSNLTHLKQSAVKVDPKIFFKSYCVPKTVYPTLAPVLYLLFFWWEKNYNKIDT